MCSMTTTEDLEALAKIFKDSPKEKEYGNLLFWTIASLVEILAEDLNDSKRLKVRREGHRIVFK